MPVADERSGDPVGAHGVGGGLQHLVGEVVLGEHHRVGIGLQFAGEQGAQERQALDVLVVGPGLGAETDGEVAADRLLRGGHSNLRG